MKTTCHSEYGTIVDVMIKPAAAAFVSDRVLTEQWKPLNFLSKPDLQKAEVEYEHFESLLTSQGAKTIKLAKDESLSIDSLYCRDASIVTDRGVILCNMGKDNRVGEPAVEGRTFLQHGIDILGRIVAPGTLEGGDCAWIDDHTLSVGHTYRTNQAGIDQLRTILEGIGVDLVVAQMPHFRGPSDVFHLMSVFSPIDKDLAVVYSPLMPIAFRQDLIARGYQFVEVPEAEFDSMGCNVLAIAPRNCLMVAGNPITRARLEHAGCIVTEYEGSDISVKGGGGPTCLTRPIRRQV